MGMGLSGAQPEAQNRTAPIMIAAEWNILMVFISARAFSFVESPDHSPVLSPVKSPAMEG
jgi:hypothetical protein